MEDLGLGGRLILKWVLWKDVRRAWTVGLSGRIILKWVLRKEVRRAWTVSLGGRIILKWVLRKEVRRAWTYKLRWEDNNKLDLKGKKLERRGLQA